MPRRGKRGADNEYEGSYISDATCAACTTADPQQRGAHHVALAREGGLDLLRAHLTEQYVALRADGRQRPDTVNDICHWVAGLMEQFGNMVDPGTGAPLAWCEARALMSGMRGAIADAACARAPEEARGRVKALAVAGFAKAEWPPSRSDQREDDAFDAAYAETWHDESLDGEHMPDALDYIQTTDTESAKAQLRGQLSMLIDPEREGD